MPIFKKRAWHYQRLGLVLSLQRGITMYDLGTYRYFHFRTKSPDFIDVTNRREKEDLRDSMPEILLPQCFCRWDHGIGGFCL